MMKHGYVAYGRGKCRCDVCRAAFSAYCRERRARIRGQEWDGLAHGSASTYQNYGCRCAACKNAQSAAHRRWYNARKKATA